MNTHTSGSADVVVIGGGMLGCNAAYHLHQAGAGRVVLVEQAPELATQTTAAGAGFVSLWGAEFAQWGERELRMERHALQFYHELGVEHDIGLKAVGMARLAVTPAGAQFLANQYAQARALVSSDDVKLLGSDQLADLTPAIDPTHVCAALYWPTAVRVDAARAARGLGRRLSAAGVPVRTGTTVTAVDIAHGRVRGVQTSEGPIATATVVSATGAWARRIGQMVGAALPFTPLLTWRFVTEPIPDLPADLPMLFFSKYSDAHDPHMYIREDNGGLLIGTYPRPTGAELSQYRQVSRDATPHSLTVPDPLVHYAERTAREFATAMPLLGTIQVKGRQIGLPAYTPDGLHLLGPVDGVQGFYVMGGDNEAGISHGPGLGKLLAELVVDGHTSQDVSAYRLDRFSPQERDTLANVNVLSAYQAIG